LYGHAQGVTPIQQASPFKGKTCPVPIDSSTPPCHHHSTTASDSTFPRSKYESPVFRQNNVRRLQRSSKERSRLHSMRKESSSQAAPRLTSLHGTQVSLWHLPCGSYQRCH